MRLALTLWIAMTFACTAVAGDPTVDRFEDTFRAKQLDGKTWSAGGENQPLQTVRDGTLRLVSLDRGNRSFVRTRTPVVPIGAQASCVVWDLIPGRTLAGPYAPTENSMAYAALRVGPSGKTDAAATLHLATWPEGYPKPKPDAEYFYTLSVGPLPSASDPKRAAWFQTWRVTAVPRRVVWTLDKDGWTLDLHGARFVEGDTPRRTGKHAAPAGRHPLEMVVCSNVKTMQLSPGARHVPGVLYCDRIAVTRPDRLPPVEPVDPSYRIPTREDVEKRLFGVGVPQRVAPQLRFGVNYASGNFRPKLGFQLPPAESLDYYQSKGIRLMRLPLNWERLQPKPNGEFDKAYFGAVQKTVAMMGERDMKVILDLHNYGRHDKTKIGDPGVPLAAFTDLWRRLAKAFAGNPAIWGYDLMNEPHHLGNQWGKVAQAGIDGIRQVDRKTPILVEGYIWSSATDWSNASAKLADELTDPADNLIYEAHSYFDHSYAGVYKYPYEYEINRPDARVHEMVGVERVRPFVEWLKATGNRGLLGEFSVPANPDRDVRWLLILDHLLDYLATNDIPATYWAGGHLWYKHQSYIIEPRTGPDRPQMKLMLKYAAEAEKRHSK